jgi:hypothetical protein
LPQVLPSYELTGGQKSTILRTLTSRYTQIGPA